jgi:hypothetical protein
MREHDRSPVAALAWIGLIAGGCASRSLGAEEGVTLPTRIVVPPCDDAALRVELLNVRRDPTSRKPSPDLRRYLIDVRVYALNYASDVWLLVDQETFPSGVDDVSKGSDGTWWFSGTDALWLGRAASRVIKNIPVSTPDQRVPVILAEIHVEGVSPQRWVERGGSTDERTTDGRLARADVNVLCASWLALRFADQGAGEP